MEKWQSISDKYINEKLVRVIISNPRESAANKKIQVRPVLLKGQILYQASAYRENKVYHENLSEEELKENILRWMQEMKQLELQHPCGNVTMLVSKKGKVTVKEQRGGRQCENHTDLSHNRAKKYILDPGIAVPFLQDLGVQTKEGKIVHAKYDKFRQINRFLEFIEDIVPELPKNREIVILDFGCGKSYLTFAMYYYLKILKHLDIRIVGLDLKEDVIDCCQELAEKYGYDRLQFLKGDIAEYDGMSQVDMVVTLHACDTATDFALHKAVSWGAKVILSVPCCQHELNGQIACEQLQPVLKYGLIRERMAALFTDALRANALEQAGYKVQILEFIDMEHTPKNILIRAVQTGKKQPKECTDAVLDFLHVHPMIFELQQKEEENE